VEFDTAAIRGLAPVDLFSLEGKVAVVTGASGGIGRWLAAGLGVAGARVLATDIASDRLTEVADALNAAGIECATLAVDLGDDDAPKRIVEGVLEQLGALDVLVNCAGVNRRMPILKMDRETYDWIMRIDLRLPYFLSQEAARVMKDRDGGAIVNISSLNSVYGLEHISVYGPAKAGLSQLTRVMALEWAQYGIRANAIAPGCMNTPLAAPIWADPDTSRWIMNRVPMKRPGQPVELVSTCQLLASDAGSFVTGQTIIVDGGFTAGGQWFTPDE
jgi:NAD(P)-dependent dehydrogenase (short-subunit alcohol dehydrogenase family)